MRKLIENLLKDPSNLFCADCNNKLHKEVYASFLPSTLYIDERWSRRSWIDTAYGKNFVDLHESFAPVGQVASTSNQEYSARAMYRYMESLRNNRSSIESVAHGVYICRDCAVAHSYLDSSITQVKEVANFSSWSEEEIKLMEKRGNKHGNYLLEKFIPGDWIERKKLHLAEKLQKEAFVRYKYEILDFILPKERSCYQKFMRKEKTASKTGKRLLKKGVDKGVDWAVYTLGYLDYCVRKPKKHTIPLHLAEEAKRFLEDSRRQQIGFINKVILIQSCWRMCETKRKQLHICKPSVPFLDVLRNAINIQTVTRSYLASRTFKKKKSISIQLQSLYHGRRARLLYYLTRECIIKIQSFLRGSYVRRRVRNLIQSRSTLSREQIVKLWRRTHIPLSYRSKFWMLAQKPGLMTYALQKNELKRLYDFVRYHDFKKSQEPSETDSTWASGDIHFFNKLRRIELLLKEPNFKFPMEKNEDSDGYKQLLFYAERLKLERVQVYEKLQMQDNSEIYHQAHISLDEKLKKVKVATLLWGDTNDAISPDISVDIMMTLFPELVTSDNIMSVSPSTKSLYRFGVPIQGTTPLFLPLVGTMHIQCRIDEIVIHDLGEILRGFVSGVKHLIISGCGSNDEADSLKQQHHRHLSAILEGSNDNNTKSLLLHQFLYVN